MQVMLVHIYLEKNTGPNQLYRFESDGSRPMNMRLKRTIIKIEAGRQYVTNKLQISCRHSAINTPNFETGDRNSTKNGVIFFGFEN